MFDLNKSIKQWRESLQSQPDIRETDIDELEDHMREEFSELKSLGLLDSEAFLISSRRLGTPNDLSSEFAIADPDRQRSVRLGWMITGALALVILWLVAEVFTNFSAGFFGGLQGINSFTHGTIGLGWVAGILRIIILGFGGMLVWRFLATDFTSHRLRNLTGKTVIPFSFLLIILVLATKVASKAFLVNMLEKDDLMDVAVTSAYINWIVMLVLPVVLLVGLWRLNRA